MKQSGGGEHAGGVRPSYRARLFATPIEEEKPQEEGEDEIMRLYKRVLSKVKQINYGYILLAIITSFYRTDFVDITIGVTFYACSKVNHKLAYYSDITCVFVIAILYSLICDFIWLGINHSQFFLSPVSTNPDTSLTKFMMVMSYIMLFYKLIVMMAYVKYISKHHKDAEIFRRSHEGTAGLENRQSATNYPVDRRAQQQPQSVNKKSVNMGQRFLDP